MGPSRWGPPAVRQDQAVEPHTQSGRQTGAHAGEEGGEAQKKGLQENEKDRRGAKKRQKKSSTQRTEDGRRSARACVWLCAPSPPQNPSENTEIKRVGDAREAEVCWRGAREKEMQHAAVEGVVVEGGEK